MSGRKRLRRKMSNEEKAALRKAKMVFEIKQPKEVMSPEEKRQVDEFLKYANINRKKK